MFFRSTVAHLSPVSCEVSRCHLSIFVLDISLIAISKSGYSGTSIWPENLYIAKFFCITNEFLYSINSKIYQKEPWCTTKPRYSEQILPVPWPFRTRVISRFNAWHDGGQKNLLGCINGLYLVFTRPKQNGNPIFRRFWILKKIYVENLLLKLVFWSIPATF